MLANLCGIILRAPPSNRSHKGPWLLPDRFFRLQTLTPLISLCNPPHPLPPSSPSLHLAAVHEPLLAKAVQLDKDTIWFNPPDCGFVHGALLGRLVPLRARGCTSMGGV